MRVFRVTVAGALVLFAVTATFGMSVKSDYEKNFDFSQLHTFAFKTDRVSNDPLSTNTLEAGRIQNALTNHLVWRGRVTDTINGVGQSEKQTDQAAKDLVSKFVKDAKKVDKNLARKSA